MKTKHLFLAALTALAFVSCADSEFVGDNSPNDLATVGDGSIQFGFNLPPISRAGDLVGSDAATKLQDQFIVYATKHTSAEAADASNDEVVFKNYVVEYAANTAEKTLSNSHNWEYVGKTPYAAAKVSPAATRQDIKYWDYSAANGYTFYGIASKADIATNNKVTVEKTLSGTTVYDKGYSVVINTGADLDKLFVADRKPVARGDYDKPVTLTFRNFGARVRAGFYETIPGYTVTINKFYTDDDAVTPVTTFGAMGDAKTTFAASLQNISTTAASNTLTVSYYNATDASVENHVKLTPSTVSYNYSLTLGAGVVGSALGTSTTEVTWDNSGNYTTVYPFEYSVSPMLVKVDYTLTAEDGSGETIEVKGANVVVPTQYIQWKSNFAYTYIFKISPATNGKTDPSQPEDGLFPITFDAVVVDVADDKTQETITAFEDYSITTYANGSEVTTNNEYKSGEVIYIVKTNNASAGAVVAPTAIGTDAGEAQVYVASTTGDAVSEATVLANLTGSPNGITLTATTSTEAASLVQYVPAADGTNFNFGSNGAVKFTPSTTTNKTYVYVFTRTAYVAPTYTADGALSSADFDGSEVYYFKTGSGVYYPAEGINAGNFETYRASLYTQTAAGTAGLYDIKVIKVKGVTP